MRLPLVSKLRLENLLDQRQAVSEQRFPSRSLGTRVKPGLPENP